MSIHPDLQIDTPDGSSFRYGDMAALVYDPDGYPIAMLKGSAIQIKLLDTPIPPEKRKLWRDQFMSAMEAASVEKNGVELMFNDDVDPNEAIGHTIKPASDEYTPLEKVECKVCGRTRFARQINDDGVCTECLNPT